jgi:co-chaperonin GroES (HSP10)
MAKTWLEPAGDQVLVIDQIEGVAIGGIELPDNVREKDMVFGVVIAVGPDAQERTKEKDIVAYGPYAGKPVVLHGVQYRLMKNGAIEGYIRTVQGGEGLV